MSEQKAHKTLVTAREQGNRFCLPEKQDRWGTSLVRAANRETLRRTNEQPSARSTHLGLRVQVCRVSGDAELHRPRFYGNYSDRYSPQPGNTRDKSKFLFLLLHKLAILHQNTQERQIMQENDGTSVPAFLKSLGTWLENFKAELTVLKAKPSPKN